MSLWWLRRGLVVLVAGVLMVVCAGLAPAQTPMPPPGGPGMSGMPVPTLIPAPAPLGTPAPSPMPGMDGSSMHDMSSPDLLPAADYVSGALVRLQTWATISVVVHSYDLYKIQLDPVADPTLAGTGFFVNPGGVIVTSPDVLAVDRARLATWGVNEAFAKTFKVALPADPYARTHAANAYIDERMQACYDPDTPDSDCAVFVTTETRAYPYVAPPQAAGLLVSPIESSGPVAMLSSTASGLVTTAELATTPAQHWTFVGWRERPTGQAPVTATGDLPTRGAPLPDADMARIMAAGGTGLRGSVLVDDRGAVVSMLGMQGGKPVAVTADAIAAALNKAGIEVRRGPIDDQLTAGMNYVASHEYANAEPYLAAAVKSSKGQAVAARYLAVARSKMNGPDDETSMANSHRNDGGASWPPGWAIALVLALAVAALLLVAWLVWRTRRRRAMPPPDPASVPAPRPPLVASEELPRSAEQRTVVHTAPAFRPPVGPHDGAPAQQNGVALSSDAPTVAHPMPTGEVAPADYCASCGANLAPGDRFCFSCGTPARRATTR